MVSSDIVKNLRCFDEMFCPLHCYHYWGLHCYYKFQSLMEMHSSLDSILKELANSPLFVWVVVGFAIKFMGRDDGCHFCSLLQTLWYNVILFGNYQKYYIRMILHIFDNQHIFNKNLKNLAFVTLTSLKRHFYVK